MPCCSCNGKRALCKGCTCAKGKKVCIDCYPGRKGKCANASIRPTASQTSSQPLLPILSPSCSSAQASQPSLQEIHLPSTRPSPTVEYYSSPHSPQPLRSSPQPAAGPPHIPPLSPPTASIRSCIRNRTPTSSPPPGHRSTKHPALRDPQETQPMFPASNPQSPPSSPASLRPSLTSRPQFPLVPPTIESLPRQPPSPPTSPEQLPGPSSRASSRVSNRPTKGQRVYSQPPAVSTCSHQTTRLRWKQQCIVEGCPELIAPSMWKAHMTLHAQEVFPGDPGWRRTTSTSVAIVFSWSPTLGLPHIPKNVLGGQLLPEAQTYLLTIHLWKLLPPTNLNQVSLHLRRCASLISQPYVSFLQDPGLLSPEHCHQLCEVLFTTTQRMLGSNYSCSRRVFFLHQAIEGNMEDHLR